MFIPSVEIVRATIELLNKYKDDDSLENFLKPEFNYVSPEDFLEQQFKQKSYDSETQDVVAEFFFRIFRFKKYILAILNEYLTSKNSCATKNLNDVSLYSAFIYLLVFELNRFTREKIEEVLLSINAKKAFSLLTFFKRKDILTKLYESACHLWDVEFVNKILENVIKEQLYKEVYDTIANQVQTAKRSNVKKLTTPIGPKCLTRPRKFKAPTETTDSTSSVTHIPVLIKASKPPSTTYIEPIQTKKIEEARRKHKQQAQELLEEADKNAFRVANTQKSDKFFAVINKIERERFGIPVRKKISKKAPPQTGPVPKKTAAVILREGARLLKLEQEEIKRYEDLASGGFNTRLITEWEEDLREEEYRQHIEDIEKKHLESLLSYEEALLAKQKYLKRKKESADEFRREKEQWMKQLEEWRNEEQLRIQESVERGKSYERGAKEAMEQVREEKHKIALETMDESRALKERRLKEREEDLQKKVQLIKEIKAFQALASIKQKKTNFADTSNLGYLCEMSIMELKERLYLLRIEFQEELERRRAEIKMKQECRKEIIDSYQELIESHQQLMKEQKKMSEFEAEKKEKIQVKRSSPSLEELRKKLYETRKERVKNQIFA